MRVVHNERKVLSWSMLSLLVIFLAQTITYVKGYPMMLEIGEEDERVSPVCSIKKTPITG